MRQAPPRLIHRILQLVVLVIGSLLSWPFANAGDNPTADECLQLLGRAFPPSLPNQVITRSKWTWAEGVTVTHCYYRGDDRRSLVRSTTFSIREQDGRRVTLHSSNLILHGGTWLAEAARTGPFTPGTDQLSIDRHLTQRDNWRLPTQLEVRLRQRATNTLVPDLGAGVLALGFMVPPDGRRLWEPGPDDRVTLRSLRERIDDANTIAVRIENASEVRTLWLDPALGMIPRQITLESYFQHAEGPRTPVGRVRFHTFRLDRTAIPPAIIGFLVDGDSQPPPAPQIHLPGEFTIERLPDLGAPTDQDFRNAIDISDGTAVRVDGLGLNSHVWSDGLVVPTRKTATP